MRGVVLLLLGLISCCRCDPPCPAGWYANGTQCQMCEAGFFQPSSGAGAEAEELYLEHPNNAYFSGEYRKGSGVFNGKPTYVSVANEICWWYVESGYNLWLAHTTCDGGLFGWASYTLAGASGLFDTAREIHYCKGCETGSYSSGAGASVCTACSNANVRRLSTCPNSTVFATSNRGTTATAIGTVHMLQTSSLLVAVATAHTDISDTATTSQPPAATSVISTTTSHWQLPVPTTTTSQQPITRTTTSRLITTTTPRLITTTTPQLPVITATIPQPPVTTTPTPNNPLLASLISLSYPVSGLTPNTVSTTLSTLSSTCSNCSADLFAVTYKSVATYCEHQPQPCIDRALSGLSRRLLAGPDGVRLTFLVLSTSLYSPPAVVCVAPCTGYTLQANIPVGYNVSRSTLLVIIQEGSLLEINGLALGLAAVLLCLVLVPANWKIRREHKPPGARDPAAELTIDPKDTAGTTRRRLNEDHDA